MAIGNLPNINKSFYFSVISHIISNTMLVFFYVRFDNAYLYIQIYVFKYTFRNEEIKKAKFLGLYIVKEYIY